MRRGETGGTVLAAVIASNARLADAPGNVLLPAKTAGLPQASVVNVSQLVTIDKSFLAERAGKLAPEQLRAMEDGLRPDPQTRRSDGHISA